MNCGVREVELRVVQRRLHLPDGRLRGFDLRLGHRQSGLGRGDVGRRLVVRHDRLVHVDLGGETGPAERALALQVGASLGLAGSGLQYVGAGARHGRNLLQHVGAGKRELRLDLAYLGLHLGGVEPGDDLVLGDLRIEIDVDVEDLARHLRANLDRGHGAQRARSRDSRAQRAALHLLGAIPHPVIVAAVMGKGRRRRDDHDRSRETADHRPGSHGPADLTGAKRDPPE